MVSVCVRRVSLTWRILCEEGWKEEGRGGRGRRKGSCKTQHLGPMLVEEYEI